MRLSEFDPAAASALLATMSHEARGLAKAAAGGKALTEVRQAFMRYTGQGHEIGVTLPDRDLTARDVENLRVRFEADYRNLFERHIPGAEIEILSWSVLVGTEQVATRKLAVRKADASTSTAKPSGSRLLWDNTDGRHIKVNVFERSQMKSGQRVAGPALILEAGTSTFVASGFDASVDGGRALVLERKSSTAKKG